MEKRTKGDRGVAYFFSGGIPRIKVSQDESFARKRRGNEKMKKRRQRISRSTSDFQQMNKPQWSHRQDYDASESLGSVGSSSLRSSGSCYSLDCRVADALDGADADVDSVADPTLTVSSSSSSKRRQRRMTTSRSFPPSMWTRELVLDTEDFYLSDEEWDSFDLQSSLVSSSLVSSSPPPSAPPRSSSYQSSFTGRTRCEEREEDDAGSTRCSSVFPGDDDVDEDDDDYDAILRLIGEVMNDDAIPRRRDDVAATTPPPRSTTASPPLTLPPSPPSSPQPLPYPPDTLAMPSPITSPRPHALGSYPPSRHRPCTHSRKSPPTAKSSSPKKQRKASSLYDAVVDSDSDLEDLDHIVEESTKQLDVTHGTLNRLKRDISVEGKKYTQLMAICQTNIRCLGVVRSHIEAAIRAKRTTISAEDLDVVEDVLEEWEILRAITADKQRRCDQLDLDSRLEVGLGGSMLTSRCGDGSTTKETKKEARRRSQRPKKTTSDNSLVVPAPNDSAYPTSASSLSLNRPTPSPKPPTTTLPTPATSTPIPNRRPSARRLGDAGDADGNFDDGGASMTSSRKTSRRTLTQIGETVINIDEENEEDDVDEEDDDDVATLKDESPTNASKPLSPSSAIFNRSDPPTCSKVRRALSQLVRAALPASLLLLVSAFGFAFFQNSGCCSETNSLKWSLQPQLRYFDGPPPL